MISCIVRECFWTTTSFDLICGHLKRMHSDLKTYNCNTGECFRTFSSIKAFYRHYKKHFGVYHLMDNNRNMEIQQHQCDNEETVGKEILNQIFEDKTENKQALP